MNRDRFPGLRDGWARLDGPAGTQMVDTAIDAMGDWISQARTRAEAVAALSALRGAEPDAVPAD